ncbi:hypothetical protein [Streptomyces abikoensis]
MSEAVRVMLARAVEKPCGLGALPLSGGQPAPLPYLVLYPLGGAFEGAPLADRSEDARLEYQVTVVGSRADQAEWLADRARRAVLERGAAGEWLHPITVPAGEVWTREILGDGGVDQSAAAEGVVTYALRFRLHVSG